MANDILQFQAGRESAINGGKRDARKHKDWLEGFDAIMSQRVKANG
jgi:hypothetical protein